MEGSVVVKGTWLDFGSDPDHYANCAIRNQAVTQHIMSGFNFGAVLGIALNWYQEQLIKFLG